jgi:hypothetical protein
MRLRALSLMAIMIVVLMAASSAFARKASHHRHKRAAATHQSTRPDPGRVQRHPEDVALDRKIGSICRGC